MKSNIELDRRTVLGTVGSLAVAGSGLAFFSTDSEATAAVNITAGNPSTVKNDRGDVSRVTINPTFRVEWSGLDVAVGKVFYLVEAKVGNGDWMPIFRSTPWLTPGHQSIQGVSQSKPGTTGHLEFEDGLAAILNRSTADGDGQDDYGLPRALTVAGDGKFGKPDYDAIDYSQLGGVTKESYFGGNSIGGAPSAMIDAGEPLSNHFPGANSGAYGAAAGTSELDHEADGGTDATTVRLRYTFELLTVNTSMKNYVGDPLGTGWFENVRSSDVREDSMGNSVLVMNGEDGYPDISGGDYGAGSQDYDELQAARQHPGIMVEQAAFNVRVKNEGSKTGVTGQSNSDAQ
jgi:hypothetical protein